MYGNGAGTGLQTVTMQKQKEAATQLVPRRATTASTAVVVGTTVRTAAPFLAVAATTRTPATTILASVLCVQQKQQINTKPKHIHLYFDYASMFS